MQGINDLVVPFFVVFLSEHVGKMLNTSEILVVLFILELHRKFSIVNLWSNGLVVKALDSQSGGPVFKTTGWLQDRLSLSSF